MSVVTSPPAFANANTCNKCNTTFGLLTRKHHVRINKYYYY